VPSCGLTDFLGKIPATIKGSVNSGIPAIVCIPISKRKRKVPGRVSEDNGKYYLTGSTSAGRDEE